jgi:hypothetical protein
VITVLVNKDTHEYAFIDKLEKDKSDYIVVDEFGDAVKRVIVPMSVDDVLDLLQKEGFEFLD